MPNTRHAILERLRASRTAAVSRPSAYRKTLGWNREQRVEAFTERMQAVHGEVHRVGASDWISWLNTHLTEQGLMNILLGNGDSGDRFAAEAPESLTVHRYDRAIEDWKAALFNDIDVAITHTHAGLAESGSLVLRPDGNEPRLMSLVPPVHIALLQVERLYENFAELLANEDWAGAMPTNLLLISGPSKTADIEQTLAYGIHGPKRLITLLLD